MGTNVNIMAPTASSGANAKQDAPVRLKLVPPLEEILKAMEEPHPAKQMQPTRLDKPSG